MCDVQCYCLFYHLRLCENLHEVYDRAWLINEQWLALFLIVLTSYLWYFILFCVVLNFDDKELDAGSVYILNVSNGFLLKIKIKSRAGIEPSTTKNISTCFEVPSSLPTTPPHSISNTGWFFLSYLIFLTCLYDANNIFNCIFNKHRVTFKETNILLLEYQLWRCNSN